MNPFRGSSKTLAYLVTALAVIILLALFVILSLPRIRASIEESGMVEMISDHLASETGTNQRLFTLYYPLLSGTEDTYRYTTTRVNGKSSESSYHSLLEALLSPMPQGPLLEGAVSFIPAGTKLVGFSLRGTIGYVALSPEFLDETPFEQCSYERRSEQITKTLKENFSLEQVVFIVSDVIIDTSLQK